MRPEDLCDAVRARLVRLPPPHAAAWGVMPVPPPPAAGAVDLAAAEPRSDGKTGVERYEAALAALARIDAMAATLHDPYIISRILTRREAVSSSSIEGTNSTLDELLSVEESEDSDASPATRQVRSYAAALDDLVPTARAGGRAVFSTELVQHLHRLVMKDDPTYRDVPGEFRRRVVWIGGGGYIEHSTFNPPPPDQVPGCLAENIGYVRGEPAGQGSQQGLLVRMALAHAHFEAIHPFRDGNGRVGRLLLPLMMAAEGRTPLYLSPYIESRKSAYYQSLKAAQQRLQWARPVLFMADAVTATVQELEATRSALAELGRRWLARRKFRQGSAALQAITQVLPHYPVVTIGRLAKLIGCSVPSAAQAVSQLEAVGILTERTGYARNRIFAANEALVVINRPFGDVPILPRGLGAGCDHSYVVRPVPAAAAEEDDDFPTPRLD